MLDGDAEDAVGFLPRREDGTTEHALDLYRRVFAGDARLGAGPARPLEGEASRSSLFRPRRRRT
ncbi:MAG: hypothetical protein BGO98_41640 [Myxococcales bacterium 68-20]|nr:MAG: hypothetical protein BGO98_41640 [Myxococcales bacterium 68-20]